MSNLLGLVMVINGFWDWVVIALFATLVAIGAVSAFCFVLYLIDKHEKKKWRLKRNKDKEN